MAIGCPRPLKMKKQRRKSFSVGLVVIKANEENVAHTVGEAKAGSEDLEAKEVLSEKKETEVQLDPVPRAPPALRELPVLRAPPAPQVQEVPLAPQVRLVQPVLQARRGQQVQQEPRVHEVL